MLTIPRARFALIFAAPTQPEPGMASKGRMFAGCTVALVTPFRDGEVDYQASGNWSTGRLRKAPRISARSGRRRIADPVHEEHERVIAAVIERAAGRAKVLPGPARMQPPKPSA